MRAAASSIGVRYVGNHRLYVGSKPSSASLGDDSHFLPASRSRRRRPGTARLSRKFGHTIVMSPCENQLPIFTGWQLAGHPRPELPKVEWRRAST